MNNTIHNLPQLALLVMLICNFTVSAVDKRAALKKGIQALTKKVEQLALKDRDQAIAEYLKGAQLLAKQFPEEVAPRGMMLDAASAIKDQAVKRAVVIKIAALKGGQFDSLTSTARGMLWRMDDPVGKPLPIKFTGLDGHKVDLAKLMGKVVLIDFWATWCETCVDEIPKLKKLYAKQHKKGLVIIGISFEKAPDSNKNNKTDPEELALSKGKFAAFLKNNAMSWPQHFDGKFWNNTIAKKFGVNSIPAMWLIDTNGNLVDMNARHNLEEKVEKLLTAGKDGTSEK